MRSALIRAALAIGASCVLATLVVNAHAQSAIKRENIEWMDVWITHGKDSALPRVLLVGDSITRAYFPEVEKRLDGKAYVGRLATSKSLGDPILIDETTSVLKQYRFDVIHFNNGMHGWDYSEAEYAAALPQWLATIRSGAPGAKLIWASTTPVREGKELTIAPRTERVRERNRIVLQMAQREGIPVDDLFAVVIDHPEFSSADGVHASPAGISAQAASVAASVEAALAR